MHMWKPTALLLLAATLPGHVAACLPSKACALEQARQLAIQHLVQEPSLYDQGGWTDMARLITMLERKGSPELAPGIAELLTQTHRAGRDGQVLHEVAFRMALTLPERALQIAAQHRNTAQRADTYDMLGGVYVDNGRMALALRALLLRGPRERTVEAARELAAVQWALGSGAAARATLTPFLQTESRDAILGELANFAAREGNYAAALKLVEDMADGDEQDGTLEAIGRLQVARRQYTAALVTLELRAGLLRQMRTSADADALLQEFAAAGAVPRALTLLAESGIEPSRGLRAIALGQLDAGDLAGARATLQRLPEVERRSPATYRLCHGLLLSAANVLTVLAECAQGAELESLAIPAAIELADRGELQRAGAILQYSVQRVQQSRPCAACEVVITVDHNRYYPCMMSGRDYQLCNLAAIQAELGLIAAAESTAAAISAPAPRVRAWVAIAKAQLARRRFDAAHRTFERSLQLALTAAPDRVDQVVEAHARAIRGNAQLRSGLANLTRAAPRATHTTHEAALRELAAAHASAGDFVAAFDVVEKLMRQDRVGGYIEIFAAAP